MSTFEDPIVVNTPHDTTRMKLLEGDIVYVKSWESYLEYKGRGIFKKVENYPSLTIDIITNER